MWRLGALFAAMALLASACGSTDDSETETGAAPTADTADTTEDAAPDTLANAVRIDAAVNARIADAADYTGVSDPVPVTAGDDIRTDTTGFAEISYFDGSVTRLDTETDFKVIELVDNPGNSIIRTQMGIGRAWHRVQALTGNDTYEVETAVATAVVRGTAFTIECTAISCTFTVLEGTLELTLTDSTTISINAGQTFTVFIGIFIGEPSPIVIDPFTDEWLDRNNSFDTDTGNNDLAADYASLPDIDPRFQFAFDLVCRDAFATTAIAVGDNYWLLEPGSATNRVQVSLAGEPNMLLLSGEAGPELGAYGDRISEAVAALSTGVVPAPSGGTLTGPIQSAELLAIADEMVKVCGSLGWSPA